MARISNSLSSLDGVARPDDLCGEEPPFSYDWQSHLFAIHRLMAKKGVYHLDEFRDAIEQIEPARYLELGYYERWLDAVPALVVRKASLDVEIPTHFDGH